MLESAKTELQALVLRLLELMFCRLLESAKAQLQALVLRVLELMCCPSAFSRMVLFRLQVQLLVLLLRLS